MAKDQYYKKRLEDIREAQGKPRTWYTTPRERQQMQELWDAGFSIHEIARRTGRRADNIKMLWLKK
jgi:hypothetical protein